MTCSMVSTTAMAGHWGLLYSRIKAAHEYAEKLAAVKRELEDRLVIVMRVYFEKPRTTIG